MNNPLPQAAETIQLGDIIFRRSKRSPWIVEYGTGATRVRLKRVREGEVEAQLVWYGKETIYTAWAWQIKTTLNYLQSVLNHHPHRF